MQTPIKLRPEKYTSEYLYMSANQLQEYVDIYEVTFHNN